MIMKYGVIFSLCCWITLVGGSEGAIVDCVTEDKKQPCLFPYQYEGSLRFECVKLSSRSRKESFCPTSTDDQGKPSEWEQCGFECPMQRYHTHDEIRSEFKDLVKEFPDHSEIFSIGTSKRGHDLFGIRISHDLNRKPSKFEFRPRVKLIGNMHGNEVLGREILIHMAKYLLLANQFQDPQVQNILANIDLYILPSMNPDGFVRAKKGRCIGENYWSGRLNEGFQDLNRDFPNWWDWNHYRSNTSYDIFAKRQPETKAVMNWTMNGYFTSSLNYHDGAVVVSIPWENYHGATQRRGPFESPDQDVLYHLATSYSLNHKTMNDTAKACPKWGTFDNGVTNSADWYVVNGSMPEFNYLFTGTFEILVEVSCCKYPAPYKLVSEWENNRNAVLAFLEQSFGRGIQGVVTDSRGRVIQDARILIRDVRRSPKADQDDDDHDGDWNRVPVRSDARGIYTRIITKPGEYEVVAYLEERNSEGLFEVKTMSRPQVLKITAKNARLERIDFVIA